MKFNSGGRKSLTPNSIWPLSLCIPIIVSIHLFISFRLNNQKNAPIVFDVMGFVHNFGTSKIELNLGGRQHQYLRTFERFVTRLNEAGTDLAFFCDGNLQSSRNDVWCERRNAEFEDSINAIDSTNENVVARKFLKRRFGCKTIVKSLLKLIEDKCFGKVIVSTHIDCDLAIAKYALDYAALAVIASDSDFLIFEGPFQWWHSNSMDMNRMVVHRFDRIKLLELFNLSREQMKYLATMAGNDHTNHWVRKRIDFNKIADYCRSLCNPRRQIYADLVKFMQLDRLMNWNEAIECVQTSIESYDLDAAANDQQQKLTKMDTYCATNVLMFAFWNQKVFQYEVNFIDFEDHNQLNLNDNNNSYPFVFRLFDTFRKLAGIMLKNTEHRLAILKIVTKYSFDEKYTLKLHTPIYPRGKNGTDDSGFDCSHCWGTMFIQRINQRFVAGYVDINAILFDESDDFDETKWRLLLWSIGLEPMESRIRLDVQDIPRQFIPTVLALTFLLRVSNFIRLCLKTFD